MSEYYNWHETLTYNADVTMIIDMRGSGKTYGFRKQVVKDWLKDRSRFVEIARHVESLKDLSRDYMGKITVNKEFPNLFFKSDRTGVYVSFKNDKGEPKKWEQLGYFVALSQYQNVKKKTYVRVKRIVMDEALIEVNDIYHRYLPNEWEILTNVVDSVTRQHLDENESQRCYLYLLANACNVVNPIFEHYQISKIPRKGYTWYAGKTFLLHFCDSKNRAERKIKNTLAGRMNARSSKVAAYNDFEIEDKEKFIYVKKSANANIYIQLYYEHMFYIVYSGDDEFLYVEQKSKIADIAKPTFYITSKDGNINFMSIQSKKDVIKSLSSLHGLSAVKYNSYACYEKMLDIYKLFGFR